MQGINNADGVTRKLCGRPRTWTLSSSAPRPLLFYFISFFNLRFLTAKMKRAPLHAHLVVVVVDKPGCPWCLRSPRCHRCPCFSTGRHAASIFCYHSGAGQEMEGWQRVEWGVEDPLLFFRPHHTAFGLWTCVMLFLSILCSAQTAWYFMTWPRVPDVYNSITIYPSLEWNTRCWFWLLLSF